MSWKFDSSIAKTFQSHATQHIPNYEQVIDLSVDVCNKFNKDAKIIDVGCAVGRTLDKLSKAGFTNIYGVDNSEAMLAECTAPGTLIHSESFPVQEAPFDVVLCNWTLHFIKDKKAYLADMVNSLAPNGVLVLTDKTNTDPLPTEFYYNYKRAHGVSDEAIQAKRASLVGVMNINLIDWYMSTLKDLGFSKIYVPNAHWCFTTFVCI